MDRAPLPALEPLFDLPPFGLDSTRKDELLTRHLLALTLYHADACPAYGRMLEGLGFDPGQVERWEQLPFLPVRLFKELDLDSCPDAGQKLVTSSGTSGQAVSKIHLDGETRALQQQALAVIVSSLLGPDRLPMLVLDCPAVIKNRSLLTARGAGILGFSLFGRGRTFALRDDMTLDEEALAAFLSKNGGKPFLLFGFTFMVWQHFYKELARQAGRFDCSNGLLIHGGGWKKLASEAVSPAEFAARLKAVCGLERVYDYYGMAEQTGSIFLQCECGHLHASNFSAVAVRRARDFSLCEPGEPGILQVLSVLPRSYPGHSLLTEDEGVLLGVDDCPCGRRGAYFHVLGRLKNAELRGCSDTYAASF